MIGIQFSWAVQIGYVTKSLLELGLPQTQVSYAWLAGPIAGILVQPLVGLLSDRCTLSLGRRRPFLLLGSIIASFCLLLFAFAAQLGRYLGDPPTGPQTNALTIAIFAFWALDFAINAAQGPLRALVADVVPPAQHKAANSYFALATGVGNCFGSLFGSVPLSKWLPVFPSDLHALYVIAVVVLLSTTLVTALSVRETPLHAGHARAPSYDTMEEGAAPAAQRRVGFFEAGRAAPYPFWTTFLVQCFTWFAWFSMFVFATSWVGAEVFNGSFTAAAGTHDRELYDAGVRLGNLGIALQAVVTIFVSLLLPTLLQRFSVLRVFSISHVILGSALVATVALHQRWQGAIAVLLLAMTGFSWAVTMTVPWSLMSESVATEKPSLAGVYFTMFNLSQCVPEILVSLISGVVVHVTGRQSAMLAIGGAVALAGAGIVLRTGLGSESVEGEVR